MTRIVRPGRSVAVRGYVTPADPPQLCQKRLDLAQQFLRAFWIANEQPEVVERIVRAKGVALVIEVDPSLGDRIDEGRHANAWHFEQLLLEREWRPPRHLGKVP